MQKSQLKNGFNWTKKDKIYSVIDVKDNNVTYVVNNPSKSTKIKTKSIEKVLKMIEGAEITTEHDQKDIKALGLVISAKKLILRDLPLVKPLVDGTETIYCFSIDNGNRFLVGKNPSDTDPIWLSIKDLLTIVDPKFLESIAEGRIELDKNQSKKEMRKHILEEMRKMHENK